MRVGKTTTLICGVAITTLSLGACASGLSSSYIQDVSDTVCALDGAETISAEDVARFKELAETLDDEASFSTQSFKESLESLSEELEKLEGQQLPQHAQDGITRLCDLTQSIAGSG